MTKEQLKNLEMFIGVTAVFCFIFTVFTMSLYLGLVGLILWVIRGKIAKAAVVHKGMPEHPNQFIMDYIEGKKSK